MADYYSNGLGRNKKREGKKRSGKELTMLIFDTISMVASVTLVFVSLAAIVCQYVSPEKSGILSIIALGIPIIYLFDLVLLFYWVIRVRWYHAAVMAFVVVLGLFYISKYYRVEVDREYEMSYKERRYIKVMTYNVHEGTKDGFVSYIKEHNPNILCLQEIVINSDTWAALEEEYNTTLQRDASAGNQILTKYKIIRKGGIEGLALRSGVWADLKIKDDTIRVVSLHLKSTSISAEDTRFLESHQYILDKQRESKLKSIAKRLVENNEKRAVEARNVARFLKESPYELIVCGDFNDVPLSYTYRTIARGLDDSFSKQANGFAYTFNTKYKLLRIDNILVSPIMDVVSYEVDNEVSLSDHFPVITRLQIEE